MIIEEEHLPATAESIPRSREIVERVCRAAAAPDAVLFALKLAVDEAVSNVVEHAYRGHAGGRVVVRVEADDDRFRVVVTDNGMRFDPTAAQPPDLSAEWSKRTVGGLGLHLVRQVVDELAYDSDADGNHLILVKKRTSRPDGTAGRQERDGSEGRNER